jgi:hypothetical protein
MMLLIHQPMGFNDDQSSSYDELMEEDSPTNGDDNNDDGANVEFDYMDEEEEQRVH